MAEQKKSPPRGGRKAAAGRRRASGAAPEAFPPPGGFNLPDDAVEAALVTGAHRDLLEILFGEALYEDLRVLAGRAQTARTRGAPRVLVLPGIMGSELGIRGSDHNDTIWIDPLDIIDGRLRDLALGGGGKAVEALGVLLVVYLKLKLRLKIAGFDAAFHPFDWRRDIREMGASLAERIRGDTAAGHDSLYLVAHSMGGLVARAALKGLADAGEADRVQRLIMLGSPNFGSFSPVQVLSGNHSLVKKVAALDSVNDEPRLVNDVFGSFTGLYQMLPAPEKYAAFDLYTPGNWPPGEIAPRPGDLAAAMQVHAGLAVLPGRFTLIAGVDQETVVGVRREGGEFRFAVSREGDGTVPLALARLDGVTTYYVEKEHGSLPNSSRVTGAVIDLLETGCTGRLPTQWASARPGETWEVRASDLAPEPFDGRRGKAVSAREVRHLAEEFAAPAAPERAETVAATAAQPGSISAEAIVVGRRRQQRLDLRLAHGSITQVDTRAVVLGLFQGVAPSGAARAVDAQLDGVILEFSERRILSAKVGDVFIMPAGRYRMGADMVVFAGLGTYDDFNEGVLRLAAENVARTLVRTKVDDFATVMVSSGSGLAPAVVLSNLVAGFLAGIREGGHLGHLKTITLCENDRARFEQLHRDLLRLAATPLFDEIEITIDILELPPPPAPAAVSREAAYPAADPVYLMVREASDPRPRPTDPQLSADFTLRASVLTGGSKATVVTDLVAVNAARLNAHLALIETDRFTFSRLNAFGAKLGKMVLPELVRQALFGMRERRLVVIHDARSSRIPWESLKIDDWAPAAEAGLSRKYEAADLSVAKWLEERRLAETLEVLLIVNPTGDLDGAEAEGRRIREILSRTPGVRVTELWREQADFSAVRAALRSGAFDVVHYAGHAFFDPVNRLRSGILCHGRHVLSGEELATIEKLPAMVFFNACESARVRSPSDRAGGKNTARRLETNVGLAEAFLRAGIGNYIGTYWPVGDDAAYAFGAAFYEAVARGAPLGDALGAGRSQVLDLRSVDWADYIHYGSPNFQVKRR